MSDNAILSKLAESIQAVIECDKEDFVALVSVAGLNAATDFAGADLSDLVLSQAPFRLSNLANSNFSNTKLIDADFSHADCRSSDFSGAYLSVSNLAGAQFTGSNFRDAKLQKCRLQNAILQETMLDQAFFERCQLRSADFVGSTMERSWFGDCRLDGAKLSGTNLAYSHFERSNLSGAKLVDANLENANFVDVVMKGTDFSGSKLSNANFRFSQVDDLDDEAIYRLEDRGARVRRRLKKADFALEGQAFSLERLESANKAASPFFSSLPVTSDSRYQTPVFVFSSRHSESAGRRGRSIAELLSRNEHEMLGVASSLIDAASKNRNVQQACGLALRFLRDVKKEDAIVASRDEMYQFFLGSILKRMSADPDPFFVHRTGRPLPPALEMRARCILDLAVLIELLHFFHQQIKQTTNTIWSNSPKSEDEVEQTLSHFEPALRSSTKDLYDALGELLGMLGSK